MENTGLEKLLKPKEVAVILKMSLSYVYKLMDDGKLAYYRFGRSRRIAPSDVKTYLKESQGQEFLSN